MLVKVSPGRIRVECAVPIAASASSTRNPPCTVTVHGALLIAVLGRIRLHPNRRGAGFRGDNFEVKQLRDGGRVAHMAREFDRHASTVNA